MQYENFKKAKEIVEQIEELEETLKKVSEEKGLLVRICPYGSTRNVLEVFVGTHSRGVTDGVMATEAETFVDAFIKNKIDKVKSLHAELEKL